MSLCSCAESGVRSSVGLAVAGCFLVTIAGLAGLGCSMLLGIPFNAATTQIVPFLSLGLGVDDMFLLVHNYKAILKYIDRDEVGMLLKETGLSALLTSVNNILAFLAGAMLPVPALRDFCLQVTKNVQLMRHQTKKMFVVFGKFFYFVCKTVWFRWRFCCLSTPFRF